VLQLETRQVYLRRHRIAQVCALLVTAQRGGKRGLEVIDAQPRVLPLPLSPTPAARMAGLEGK